MSIGSDIVARARARGEAHAAEQVAARTRLQGRLTKPGPTRTAGDVARKMADDMLDVAAVRGSADEDDLLGRGWTLEAIRTHGPAARDLANVARERQV